MEDSDAVPVLERVVNERQGNRTVTRPREDAVGEDVRALPQFTGQGKDPGEELI